MEFKDSLMELKGSLMEFKGSLMEFKGSLMEFKGSLMEFKGSLMEFKGSLMEIKGSLMEFKDSFTIPNAQYNFWRGSTSLRDAARSLLPRRGTTTLCYHANDYAVVESRLRSISAQRCTELVEVSKLSISAQFPINDDFTSSRCSYDIVAKSAKPTKA
ncbi:hypothetical protein [Nostoc sp.]|uniref:hypothetical protein n=1 Tax=Nostoc sp. TaxID=1180 RepID=UPI002FFC2F1D